MVRQTHAIISAPTIMGTKSRTMLHAQLIGVFMRSAVGTSLPRFKSVQSKPVIATVPRADAENLSAHRQRLDHGL